MNINELNITNIDEWNTNCINIYSIEKKDINKREVLVEKINGPIVHYQRHRNIPLFEGIKIIYEIE